MTNTYPVTAHQQLIALIGATAAEASTHLDPPRLPLCLTYEAAGQQLSLSADSVRALVRTGVLDQPEWARTEIRRGVVTTASVARAAGWPIAALEIAVPASEEAA